MKGGGNSGTNSTAAGDGEAVDTGDWPPLSKEKYLAQCLQFLEPQAGATIKRSVNFGGGQFSSGEWKYAGGVVEIVRKCSEVFATTTLPTSTLNNKSVVCR